jgi:RNA polymerase sigma factor (TIGR02999 family)
MSEVTQILSKIESGDEKASEELLPLVYDELRKLAAARMISERPDHTLSATALVHEAYVRLVDEEAGKRWVNRSQFFKAAAEAMRRILIESARRKQALKRGGDFERSHEDPIDLPGRVSVDPDWLMDLDDRLKQLESENSTVAEFVKLRLFSGLSIPEAGELLGMPRSTAYASWRFVRAWFELSLSEGASEAG